MNGGRRTAIVHLGSTGAGPQLQLRTTDELRHLRDVAVIAVGYSELREKIADLEVPTLFLGDEGIAGGTGTVWRRLLSTPLDSIRMARFCREQSVGTVLEVMDHPLQFAPRMLLKLLRTNVVVSVHDARRHAGEENRLMELLSNLGVRVADRVVVYSQTVGEELAQLRPTLAPRIRQTVHAAFGVSTGIPRKLPDPEARATVGFFGRIERYKGLSRLVEAVAGMPSSRVRLRIVGRGEISAQDKTVLENLGAQIDNRWIPDEEIQDVIAGFDILALPYDEASQSGVIGYAMAAGVPVVATPVGGVRAQVEGPQIGKVARDLSVQEFRRALHELLSDRDSYEKASRAGLEASQGDYSWARTARDLHRVLEELQPSLECSCP